MKEKKKRYERSDEEIIAELPKRWKPAKTLEEARERAVSQAKKFNSLKDDLNAIWNLFRTAPEIFLFDDVVETIRQQYKSSHLFKYNKADTQIDNLEFSLDKMQLVAKKLYADLFNKSTVKETKTEEKVEKEPQEKETSAPKRKILTSAIKKSLAGDKTDMSEFVQGCNEAKSKVFLDYLKSKGVSTLGEYLALLNEPSKINAYRVYISHHDLQDVHIAVSNKIVKLAASLYNKDIVENETSSEVKEVRVQPAAIQETPAETAEQKIEVSDEEFFEYLKTLPASHFVKGSKEMERIAERYREYLDNQTRPFVDECFSEEDLKKFIEEEDKKYRPIVNAKREQYEKELKRDAVAAYTRRLIDESVKYHHDPKMFDHQPKHEGHMHFPDNGREL